MAEAKAKAGGGSGISQPVKLSPELAKLLGETELSRSEVTKRIWDHIKKHDLQDAKDRRQINPDAALMTVLGKPQVSMFEMTKLVSKHLS